MDGYKECTTPMATNFYLDADKSGKCVLSNQILTYDWLTSLLNN